MANSSYTNEQLILAARLYFLDQMPQAQIGRLVNVSQSKVSRMLALARERGLVRIVVPEYEPRNAALEKQLHERLGVEAIVVRSAGSLEAAELRQTIGYFAAPAVAQWLGANRVVAIAGGRTIQALVERLKPAGPGAMTVVQAMGSIDSSTGPYDALELGRRLAQAWQGSFLTLNTPAILPDPETCRRVRELGQVKDVLRRLEKSDVALVGVGSLENSVFVERRSLAQRDMETLREAGAVGEILGRFYNGQGKELKTPLRDRVISLSLDALRRVPMVIAVVSGSDRSAAVAAAINGGLIKALVIDEGGASAVMGSVA